MRIGSTLLVLTFLSLAPGAARAQGIDCPDVDFTTQVGSRTITLRWQDPPPEARTRVDVSLLKIGDFLPPEAMDDSLAWRGTALPTVSGSFTGRCDYLYVFNSETADSTNANSAGFTSADLARVSASWSGTSMPVSGGSLPTCTGDSTFVFTVAQGGVIDSVAGAAAQIAWTQGAARSGTLDIPASYMPRQFLDVASGLEVAFTPGTLVAGETFSIAIIPPGQIDVRWNRFKLPNTAVVDDTSGTGTPGFGSLTFCRPDTALEFDQGLFLSLSPGSVFEANFDGDSLGVFRVRAQSYDGFRIRRTDISNLNEESMTMLREYYLCRDEDAEFFEGPQRVYEDVEVHNGFPYQYAVTCFDTLSHTESAIQRTESLYPRTLPGDDPNQIQVVPNPYKRRVSWEEGGEARVQFVNVPVGTFLRIYTAAGNLVREIPAEEVSLGCSASGLSGCINWNLRNGQGEEIVSGVYIFQAEAPGGKMHIGKFMVAR